MLRIASLSVVLVLVMVMVTSAVAGPNANEFKFVGAVGACGPGYPAGAKIVQSFWQTGIGLPDNGGSNTPVGADDRDLQNPNDNRYGLLVMKNGPTPVCASAGVTFSGFSPFVVGEGNKSVGFDYLNGSTCDGGSPRFNITYTPPGGPPNQFSFVGNCALGTTTTAPQDPAAWSRISWDVTDGGANPPIPSGSTITAISVVFDEGTDTGPGFAILDNILVNGKYQARESGQCPSGSVCTGIPPSD